MGPGRKVRGLFLCPNVGPNGRLASRPPNRYDEAMRSLGDTIAAVCTPPGMASVGIVRVSGPRALDLATAVFQSSVPIGRERALRFGPFMDPVTGEILDEGILLVMPAPGSYTGEDVVEFHAHGSPPLLGRLLDVLVTEGARPADAGEFTYRAVLNGRLDLPQAEAVQALVSAQGDAARREAVRQLTGGLASHLAPMEEALKDLYQKVEARLEFPDEGLPPLDREGFERQVVETGEELVALAESYRKGRVLTDGLKTAIVGPPNSGKSSLMNALLGKDKVIVSPHAGTTRDVVEGEMIVKGARIRLYDTAGLRETSHQVEEEGVKRSRTVIQEADLILWVLDASGPMSGILEAGKADLPKDRTFYLFNKTDLLMDPKAWKKEMGLLPDERCLALSCKSGAGLSGVVEVLESAVEGALMGEDVVLLSARHRQEAEEALRSLAQLGVLMEENRPMELWAEELKKAVLAIGRIRGRDLPAEAFDGIFSHFCIGK